MNKKQLGQILLFTILSNAFWYPVLTPYLFLVVGVEVDEWITWAQTAWIVNMIVSFPFVVFSNQIHKHVIKRLIH